MAWLKEIVIDARHPAAQARFWAAALTAYEIRPYDAAEIARAATEMGLRVSTDLRNEKINYKVREHSLAKVPVMLVCGKREAEESTVNIRRLGSRDQVSMGLEEALAAIFEEAMPPDLKRRKAQRKAHKG